MADSSTRFAVFVLYIGPDVLMPVASAIAAFVGILLMFWRRTVAVAATIRDKIMALFRRG